MIRHPGSNARMLDIPAAMPVLSLSPSARSERST
jgi:hypothetical protein